MRTIQDRLITHLKVAEGWDETRCLACGCYMGTEDTSTENGYDFEFVCNNRRCKSNRRGLK